MEISADDEGNSDEVLHPAAALAAKMEKGRSSMHGKRRRSISDTQASAAALASANAAAAAGAGQKKKGKSKKRKGKRRRHTTTRVSVEAAAGVRESQQRRRLSLVPEINQEPAPDAAAGPPADDRDALERLYRRAAPGNLDNVDVILRKFDGRREDMYRLLENMFPDEAIERPPG